MKSWKTSVAGIAAIVAAIANAVAAQYDQDPATVPDWPLVVGLVIAGLGLLKARDNDKTSEQVGAKTKALIRDYTPRVLVLCLLPMAGCNALPQSGNGDTDIPVVTIHNREGGTVNVSGNHISVDNSGDQAASQKSDAKADGKLDVTVPLVP